jgi:hypothetical protein
MALFLLHFWDFELTFTLAIQAERLTLLADKK